MDYDHPGLAGFRFASLPEIDEHFGCEPGYLGPVGLKKPLSIVVDREVALMSDWICGADDRAPVRDLKPQQIVGEYVPNAPLTPLHALLFPAGVPLTDAALRELLLAIQENEVAAVGPSRDDMTIIGGERQMS